MIAGRVRWLNTLVQSVCRKLCARPACLFSSTSPRDVAWLWLAALTSAIAAGLIHGRLEGVLYPQQGEPRAGLWTHWATLGVALYLATFGLVSVLAPRVPRRRLVALALLPVALVGQDAISLHYQGVRVSEATWYAEVWGHNLLTDQLSVWPGLPPTPGWYSFNVVLSLCLLIPLIHWSGRAPRAEAPASGGQA